MPANLTAEAKSRWMRASSTKDPQEKIKALEEFLSSVPKHKGNERLRGQVKRKISALRLEVQDRRRHSGSSKTSLLQREGVAQIVILGLTNSGKSSLLSSITKAKPVVADYEFTTQRPVPGMLRFMDIQFQLIEVPALTLGAAEGSGWNPQVLSFARNSDGLIIVLDMSKDPSSQFGSITSELEKAGITLERQRSQVEIIRKKGLSGIQILLSGSLIDCGSTDVEALLRSYGLHNVAVRIWGEAKLEDAEEAVLESSMSYKPSIIVANKMDLAGAEESLVALRRYVTQDIKTIPLSCATQTGLEEIGASIFQALRLVRVYTKDPNQKDPSEDPIVVKEGTPASEVARQIHSDMQRDLRYAKVWGPSSKYPGEKVGPTHILKDGDVVEFHTR